MSRFAFFEQNTIFVNDQGRDLFVLLRMVQEGKIPLIGPSTSLNSDLGSMYFGPSYYYFLFPLILIQKDPLLFSSVVPVLFLLVIVLMTFMAKLIPKDVRLLFLFFFIFSSFGLYYTHFLWNLNIGFLLSFILFLIYIQFHQHITSRIFYLLVFGFVSGFAFQMHYGTFFLFAAIGISILKKYNTKKALFYFLGIITSFAPMMIFDIRHHFILSRTIYGIIASFAKDAKKEYFDLFSTGGSIFDAYIFPAIQIHPAIKTIIAVFVLMVIISYLIKAKDMICKTIFYGFILFLVSFVIFKREFAYYLACFFPFYCLGFSYLVLSLLKSKNKIKYGIIIGLVVYFLINTKEILRKKDEPLSLAVQKKAAFSIAESIQNKSNTVLLSAYPHHDDRNGIAYILKTKYSISENSKSENAFILCFSPCTKTKDARLIMVDSVSIYRIIK